MIVEHTAATKSTPGYGHSYKHRREGTPVTAHERRTDRQGSAEL